MRDQKIAVPVNNENRIDGHFGHCQHYKIYTINDDKVTGTERIESEQGCGCKSNIALTLAQKNVSTMLVGNIGDKAVSILNSAGIDVIRGCSGEIDKVIESYTNGQVSDNGINCQNHEEDHNCHH